MAPRSITKAQADLFLKAIRILNARAAISPDAASIPSKGLRKVERKRDRMLTSASSRAFKMSGLNPKSEEDRELLLGYLAALIYAGKGRGRPKKWTNRRLARLSHDVA